MSAVGRQRRSRQCWPHEGPLARRAYDGGMPRLARVLGLSLIIAALLFLPAWATAAVATATPTGAPVVAQPDEWGETDLILFWGDGCPHCEAEMQWLEQAVIAYPELTVHQYEVWYDEANRTLLSEVAAELGFEPSGVP